MKKNLKVVSAMLFVTCLSTNGYGDDLKKENFFEKEVHKVLPATISPETRLWLGKEGPKVDIFTTSNSSEKIELVTGADGKMIFETCECGPDSCFPMLPPMYTFSPDELMHGVSTFKGVSSAVVPIAVGGAALILAAVNPVAALGGLFGFIGSALNPQGKAQTYGQQALETKQLVEAADKKNAPFALRVGDSFETNKVSYINFLTAIKAHEGNSDEKTAFSNSLSDWVEDVRLKKKEPLKTCASELQGKLDRTLAELDSIKKDTQSTREILQEMQRDRKAEKTAQPTSSEDVWGSPRSTNAVGGDFQIPYVARQPN